jgi:hypothetical protein
MSVLQKVKDATRCKYFEHSFPFDYVFDKEHCKDLYECLRPTMDLCLNGGIGSVLLYGQSGSGKFWFFNSGKGYTVQQIKEFFLKNPFWQTPRYRLSLYVFELTGSHILNFLNGSDQLVQMDVITPSDLDDIFTKVRKIRSDDPYSSQNHLVFQLIICDLQNARAFPGVFNIIELAGSEHKDLRNADMDLKETMNSIHVLKTCIRNRIKTITEPITHGNIQIPFSSSKITSLLSEIFDPSSLRVSRTIFIACVSPSSANVQETIQTLTYATSLNFNSPKVESIESITYPNPYNWTNEEFIRWGMRKSPRFQGSIMCPNRESGMQMTKVPKIEFIKRCMVCGIHERVAKNIHHEFWEMIIEAKTKNREGEVN